MATYVKTLTNSSNTDEILPKTIATAVDMVSSAKTVEQEIIDLKANKVTVVSGKQLSTEDYTTVDKNKLASLSKYASIRTPISATDTGVAGEICWDANYIYVCVATNTWKRVAIQSW